MATGESGLLISSNPKLEASMVSMAPPDFSPKKALRPHVCSLRARGPDTRHICCTECGQGGGCAIRVASYACRHEVVVGLGPNTWHVHASGGS